MVLFLLSCGSHPSNNQWIKSRKEEIFRKKTCSIEIHERQKPLDKGDHVCGMARGRWKKGAVVVGHHIVGDVKTHLKLLFR